MNKGKFIVFEGIDGSGKGTQINLLVEEMKHQGRTVYQTAEPTNSVTGGILRDALGGFTDRNAYEMSAMFLLDRIFHNSNKINGIRQFLEKGIDVVCDRYYYSSFAYQGMDMNLNCKEILKPDLCIFLDIDSKSSDERISKNRLEREIYEEKEMQERIRNRFLEVFGLLKDSENVKIVDASRSIEEVSADIINIYNEFKGDF